MRKPFRKPRLFREVPPPRDVLRSQLLARKGGVIGTGGRAVVALRFDDTPFAFRHKILPLLVSRGLPYTRVTTSYKIHSGTIQEKEFPLLQKHAINYGGEIWNHGATHTDASGSDEMYRELIEPLYRLRSMMPRIPIDCFSPPGGATISFDGFMPAQNNENWLTEAGSMLREHHALVSGYLQNTYYRNLTGYLRDGQIHYSLDPYNYQRSVELIDRVVGWTSGTVLMWHANKIDAENHMSLKVFEEVLDYIVNLRDSGKLQVLTCSGLSVADAGSSYRDNALATSEGDPFEELITYAKFRESIPGSTRELTAEISAPPGSTVTSFIGSSKRAHLIPESGFLKLRHVATIPLDVSKLRVSIDAKASKVSLNAV